MEFFNSAIEVLQTLVVALGAGLGVWGAADLLEGYGGDNPSAKSQGTKQLMRVIAGRLRELPPVTVYEPEYVKPLAEAGDADELQIEHYDDLWVVSGKWLQKLLNDINFDDYESRMYFDRQLRKSGLFDRLEEQGIEDGDTVSIYDFEFDYTK